MVIAYLRLFYRWLLLKIGYAKLVWSLRHNPKRREILKIINREFPH